MKRLLVFVFALAFLVSCSKRRFVHFEAVMVSNTNIVYFSCLHPEQGTYGLGMGVRSGKTPISVGERGSSSPNTSVKKGDNILLSLTAFCDSTITNGDTIQCDFEMILGFFVDDVLIEERIISHIGSEIKQITWDGSGLIGGTTPITDEDILDKTINFIVP
jgi:hypothetical protein